VGEALIPILSKLLLTEKPLNPFSTKKAVIPRAPLDLSTVAMTMITSAMGPLVMKVLVPLRM
jgi:hypothetical protein